MLCYFCLFDLILYATSISYKGTGLHGLNRYQARINVLAQGHTAVMPVRLEPAAPRSRVKHSTTEPLRSQYFVMTGFTKTANITQTGTTSIKVFGG